MGQIMKESKGQVNPKMANQILIQSLQKELNNILYISFIFCYNSGK